VPTPISHAAVGYALGLWTQRGVPVRRVSLAALACAILPDIDVLASPFVAHRGITHSLLFAVGAAALATVLLFPRASPRRRILLVLLAALLSHSLLDALTTYSRGIAFLAPFSDQRYRFVWTPLGVSDGRLSRQLMQEALLVFIPALLAAWAGRRVRRSA